MGLFVLTEGTSSYNDDILLEEVTEKEFKEFDAFMKSDEPFDLGGNPQQTGKNIEKEVKEAEKK